MRHLHRRRHPLPLGLERVPHLGQGPELLRPGLEHVVRAAAERNQRLARLAQLLVLGRLGQRLETPLDRGRRRREPLADGLDQGRIVDVRRLGQQARRQIALGAQRQQRLQGIHPALDQAGDRLLALGRHLLAGDHEVEAGVVHQRLQNVLELGVHDGKIGDRGLPLRAQSQALLDGAVQRFELGCDLAFDLDQIGEPRLGHARGLQPLGHGTESSFSL